MIFALWTYFIFFLKKLKYSWCAILYKFQEKNTVIHHFFNLFFNWRKLLYSVLVPAIQEHK